MKKIVLIHPIPTHYRIPLFNEISKELRSMGILLKVLFCHLKTGRRKHWKINFQKIDFEYRFLNAVWVYIKGREFSGTYMLPIILSSEKPDLIICTGFSIPSIIAHIYCRLKQIPYIIWSGAFGNDLERNPVRKKVRKLLTKRAAAYIAYGNLAKEYLKTLGTDKKEVFIAMNTVDTHFFEIKDKVLNSEVSQARMEHFSSTKNILYVGDLIKRKGVDFLIRAINELNKQHSDFCLHLVGDGPERQKLEEYCQNRQIHGKVYFWGHKSQKELLQMFTISDIFVFPTLFDPWGLVLNEAMAAGLPVIASKYAGATYDLVEDGVNGFVVDPYDVGDMANKIGIMLKDDQLRKKMGINTKKIIRAKCTIEKSAQGFISAVRFVYKI